MYFYPIYVSQRHLHVLILNLQNKSEIFKSEIYISYVVFKQLSQYVIVVPEKNDSFFASL